MVEAPPKPMPAMRYGRTPALLFDAMGGPALCDVTIRPSTPLSPAAATGVVAALGLSALASALAFLGVGAWPVAGFFALAALGVAVAFGVALRRGRYVERIRVDADGVWIGKTSPSGRFAVWRLAAAFTRLTCKPRARILLEAHGQGVTVGACLSGKEREALAERLRAALQDVKIGR